MSDENSDKGRQDDDAWLKALGDDDSVGPEDAKLIRALLIAHEETTRGDISDEELEYAKISLQKRLELDVEDCGDSQDSADVDTKSNVVRLFTKLRRDGEPRSMRATGTLLAAGVAIVAVGIMTFGGPVGQNGADPYLVSSYGELDTLRGFNSGDNRIVVEDPASKGLELGRLLMERDVPFELWSNVEDSTTHELRVQIDGIPNPEDAWEVLREIGVDEAPTSVVVIRLETD